MGPSWSISVEFYTYILWAFCLVLFRKNIVLLCSVGFALLAWFIMRHSGSIIYNYDYGFVRCLYSFLIGMLTYRLSRKVSYNFAQWQYSVVEVLLLVVTIVSVSAFTHLESWMMPWLFAVVILVFSREGGVVSRQLATDRFAFLGTLSYSYYLNHTVVLAVMDLLFFKLVKLPHSTAGELLFVFVCLACVHLLSVFTHRHIELILQSVSPNRTSRTASEMAIV